MTAAAATAIPRILDKTIILFPGQGAQYVGMCKNLCPKALTLFDMANQYLGYDLLKMSQNGPESELNRTVYSQPAIFVSSLAAVENLADRSKTAVENCTATAGFSLGEYASLVFAQSMDFIEALRIVKLRAEITQIISDSMPSGMVTVVYGLESRIGLACKLAEEFCIRSGMSEDESVCSVSNDLFPHVKVIGGHEVALEFIEKNFKDFGIRRMKRLKVSGAFHTRLMKPAAEDLKKELDKINIKTPKIPVYSNVTANIYKDPEEIRSLLAKHVHEPVLWEQTMNKMYRKAKEDDGLPVTFECGPSNTLTSLITNLQVKKLAYNIEP